VALPRTMIAARSAQEGGVTAGTSALPPAAHAPWSAASLQLRRAPATETTQRPKVATSTFFSLSTKALMISLDPSMLQCLSAVAAASPSRPAAPRSRSAVAQLIRRQRITHRIAQRVDSWPTRSARISAAAAIRSVTARSWWVDDLRSTAASVFVSAAPASAGLRDALAWRGSCRMALLSTISPTDARQFVSAVEQLYSEAK
jgi:hypothetical protein